MISSSRCYIKGQGCETLPDRLICTMTRANEKGVRIVTDAHGLPCPFLNSVIFQPPADPEVDKSVYKCLAVSVHAVPQHSMSLAGGGSPRTRFR